MPKRGRPPCLAKRDIDILVFLWKYKVSTTEILHKTFLSNITFKSAYVKLIRLKIKSYIKTYVDETGQNHVWDLTKKGFDVVKKGLPELRAECFKSENKEHDLIASSIQLGEIYKQVPEDIILVTEQMLSSYDLEFLPSWIPNVNEHIPDGYWYFTNGNEIKLLSLEVELNNKSRTRYKAYASFYEQFERDSRVLWIVKSKHQIKQILESMYEYEPDYKIHNFVFLKSILKDGWNSKVVIGPNQNEKVSELFTSNSEVFKKFSRSDDFINSLRDRRITRENT